MGDLGLGLLLVLPALVTEGDRGWVVWTCSSQGEVLRAGLQLARGSRKPKQQGKKSILVPEGSLDWGPGSTASTAPLTPTSPLPSRCSKPVNMTKATINYRHEKTHMMSAIDRSFTDQSTLQEDERLGLSFMDTHNYSNRGKDGEPRRAQLWSSSSTPKSAPRLQQDVFCVAVHSCGVWRVKEPQRSYQRETDNFTPTGGCVSALI